MVACLLSASASSALRRSSLESCGSISSSSVVLLASAFRGGGLGASETRSFSCRPFARPCASAAPRPGSAAAGLGRAAGLPALQRAWVRSGVCSGLHRGFCLRHRLIVRFWRGRGLCWPAAWPRLGCGLLAGCRGGCRLAEAWREGGCARVEREGRRVDVQARRAGLGGILARGLASILCRLLPVLHPSLGAAGSPC